MTEQPGATERAGGEKGAAPENTAYQQAWERVDQREWRVILADMRGATPEDQRLELKHLALRMHMTGWNDHTAYQARAAEEAEREMLTALRRLAIRQWADWQRCTLCGRRWLASEAESHRADCWAALSQESS